MQDALIHVVKSVSLWANAAREAGATDDQLAEANIWTLRSVFSTLTNVNFSEERIAEYVQEGMAIRKELEKLAPSSPPTGPVAEIDLLGKGLQELEEFGLSVSIPLRQAAMGNDDCFSLTEIATYGAKGVLYLILFGHLFLTAHRSQTFLQKRCMCLCRSLLSARKDEW